MAATIAALVIAAVVWVIQQMAGGRIGPIFPPEIGRAFAQMELTLAKAEALMDLCHAGWWIAVAAVGILIGLSFRKQNS